jgi:hypothetical protein
VGDSPLTVALADDWTAEVEPHSGDPFAANQPVVVAVR